MNRNRHQLLTPLILLLLTACSADSDSGPVHDFRIFEEDGVTISESTGGPKYSGEIFTFEEIFELEQDESRPETLLNAATGYTMDDDGLIFVFDRGDSRIVVFDQYGQYLRAFGRKGAGPGEFDTMRLSWMKDGIIAVYDFSRFRASTFTTDGRFLDSYTRPGASNRMMLAPIMRMLRTIYPLSDGRAVQIFTEQSGWGTVEQKVRWSASLVSPDGDSLLAFSTSWSSTPVYPSRQGSGVVGERPMFTTYPTLQAHVDRGMLIADPQEPIIQWYDFDGDLKQILRLGLDPVPVSSEEKAELDRLHREQVQNADGPVKERIEESWQYTTIPEFKSHWSSLLVDDQGFYWLMEHDDLTQPLEIRRQASYKVFSPEGEYLGSATWPSRVASISRGHFMGRQIDEETYGYRYIVYRIQPVVEGLEY